MNIVTGGGGEAINRLAKLQAGVAVLGDEHGLSMMFGCGAQSD